MAELKIKIGSLELTAQASEENPLTFKAILDKLPIQGAVKTWGQEIYFFVPFSIAEEQGKIVVEPGEIGFWPGGPGIAIFWGKTPASENNKPTAASPVNVFARLKKIPKEKLDAVEEGTPVFIERIGE